MGEAKRRKLAGTYPSCNCSQVEKFRAPKGTIAITIDVKGIAPATAVIDASAAVNMLEKITSATQSLSYYATVRHLAGELTRARRTGDHDAFRWIGCLVLWTSFNHPKIGNDMRKAVSEALRREGKAHISWFFSPTKGLVIALAEKFIDLEQIAAAAPSNVMFRYAGLETSETKQH